MLCVPTFQPSPITLKPSLHPSSSLTFLNPNLSFRRQLPVRSLKAAHHQLCDYEPKLDVLLQKDLKLKIAIVGFGSFGQFLAKTFVSQGHDVLAHSRSDYSDTARKLGVSFFPSADDLCKQNPEVILLCTSIVSMEQVLLSLPFHRLERSTLIVDVLSVKEFPKNLLLQLLPRNFDIICSHPMFGPESAKHDWSDLNFVYEKVRIGDEESRIARCEKFLGIFARQGCRMVEMACADHDRYAAESQFITHTVGRIMKMLMLESTPINTKGYESLLELVVNTSQDSFDLYYGLFMFNHDSLETLQSLDLAFQTLRNQLISRCYYGARKQLYENAGKLLNSNHTVLNHAQNGAHRLFLSSQDTR